MNKTIICCVAIFMTGCTRDDNVMKEIIIDVSTNYPEKKLYIQDIADVEYLALETDENYLFSYLSGISEHFVIGANHVENSFVFFSRETGKPVSKISRYGNGPEEYNLPVSFVYSEEDDEFFILDYPAGIKVYGRDGSYKRKLQFRERSYIGSPEAFYDYDTENLLYYDGFQGSINDYSTAFVMVSKKDGSITKEIPIPYKKKINLMFTQKSDENAIIGTMPNVYFAVRNGKDFLLTDYSSGTVYRLSPEKTLHPVLVRKPSIQTMEPKIILNSWLEVKEYLFFSTNKLEVDWNAPSEFAEKGLLVEKRSGDVYQAIVQMNDYKGKILHLGPAVLSRSLRDTRTGFIALPAAELSDAYAAGKLSDKLKETASRLTENDESVVMILQFK